MAGSGKKRSKPARSAAATPADPLQTTSREAPIRLGIVGASGFARLTIDALADRRDFQVVAVADLKRELAESAAARFDAKVYLDVRSMLVESPIEACLMSLPHDEYPEYVRLAGQRGLHLLKEKPLGRSFDEALALVDEWDRQSARSQRPAVFMIGTQRRFLPGFAAMKQRLAEMRRPFMVRSHFLFNWNGDFGWRGQKKRAGFGVLGDAGYHNIDLLNWLLGPPIFVYSSQSTGGRPNPDHPYDTDDTALCMLQYPGGLVGYVACSWVTSPDVIDVIVHGPDGTMIATSERLAVLDLAGKRIEETSAVTKQASRQAMIAKLDAFAAAVRGGGQSADSPAAAGRQAVLPTYACSARENLINQAVVEAAYLSGLTGQPQSPAKIFELRGRSIEEFLG